MNFFPVVQLEVGSSPYSNSSAEQQLPPQPGVAQPAVVPPKNRIAKPIFKKIAKHNSPAMRMHSSNMTRGSPNILSTSTCSLHLQWSAPTSSCSIYVIEYLVSGKRTTTHIHNLRPFNYDPAYTSPLTVAQHKEQEFIVESNITHRGSRNRRSWETCDSWEPFIVLARR